MSLLLRAPVRAPLAARPVGAAPRLAAATCRAAPLRLVGPARPSLGLTGLCSAFAGASLAPDARRPGTGPARGALTIVANSKTCLGCTKRGTRRRAVRVSGFRARMASPTGRAVLKARRKKGRKALCTKTLYKKQ